MRVTADNRIINATPAERIKARSVADEAGCWIWQCRVDRHGYGKIGINRTSKLAHRVSYETFVGPIPEGLQLDHLCRVRACVNPAHLEPVTHRENGRRGTGFAARCARKTHCPRGHAYDEANTRISPQGSRICRACMRLRTKGGYAAKTEGTPSHVS